AVVVLVVDVVGGTAVVVLVVDVVGGTAVVVLVVVEVGGTAVVVLVVVEVGGTVEVVDVVVVVEVGGTVEVVEVVVVGGTVEVVEVVVVVEVGGSVVVVLEVDVVGGTVVVVLEVEVVVEVGGTVVVVVAGSSSATIAPTQEKCSVDPSHWDGVVWAHESSSPTTTSIFEIKGSPGLVTKPIQRVVWFPHPSRSVEAFGPPHSASVGDAATVAGTGPSHTTVPAASSSFRYAGVAGGRVSRSPNHAPNAATGDENSKSAPSRSVPLPNKAFH
ncbi:MAG TPA: hypothetical protein PLS46_00600, partial [Microthrixaceae bacterium]|nr:hypothetical protein [Microthrixaceae bacterium]